MFCLRTHADVDIMMFMLHKIQADEREDAEQDKNAAGAF